MIKQWLKKRKIARDKQEFKHGEAYAIYELTIEARTPFDLQHETPTYSDWSLFDRGVTSGMRFAIRKGYVEDNRD